ncbi:LysM peptidoglycan-binding domain-containing protein [Actinospongicola halichondriae]|uniref:LysM peptidoglycan-binding domain-containing protein n=1 Tax=Actinospongicola halichondriae TaxID=3236844 RepID=UPI003D413CBD
MAGADQRVGRTLAWIALLVAAIVALRLAATGDLAPPPLTSLDALGTWTDGREPAAAAIALVRFVAELTAWYLLGLSTLVALATALRSGGVASLADALAVPGATRLVRGGLGLGLVAATAVGAATSEPEHAATAGAVMQPLRGEDAPHDNTADGTARMVPVTVVASPPAAPTIVSGASDTWTVSEGESLWSIATDVLAAALGRTPDDAEIDPYWRALIDANRHRLVDPDDADLIHPGQVFETPTP